MDGVEVWRVWVKTEDKFRKRWERPSERQEKHLELLHTASQRGKHLVTRGRDQEVKTMRVMPEVHHKTAWKDGVALYYRGLEQGRGGTMSREHSLKKPAMNKEEAVQ